MSDIIAAFKDADGRVHFTSRTSQFAVKGLDRGELTEVDLDTGEPIEQPQEQGVEADATINAASGDDPEPRRTGRRPRDAQPASRAAGGDADAGVAGAEVDS